MKKLILAMAVVAGVFASLWAGVPITKVDRIEPTDGVFMDMACTAASKSVADQGKPCGAVVILNGAWKGSGTPSASGTAARLKSLENATVYTVCEPTTEAYNEICRMNADRVYFAIPRSQVIAKGIYPASAYDDSKIDSTLTLAPLLAMDYDEASALVK